MRITTLLAALTLLTCGHEVVAASDFQPIFDGKTLDGWVTKGGRYDGNAAWSVEEGAIVGRQNQAEGGLLYTAKPYSEFELELECKLDWPFDSGIFLRMAPAGRGAQVTLDHRADGEIGAIYSDGFLKHTPGGAKLWKKDEWNKVFVRCTGKDMRIVVLLNGEPLVDYEVPPGTEGFAPTGLIGLQVHGERDDPAQNACRFRNVRLRELSTTSSEMFVADANGALAPTPWGVANGWTPLFDGRSLAGWEEAEGSGGFAWRDGTLALLTQGGAQSLRTKEDFADFTLRLDFKMARMTNSGLFLRGDRTGGNPAFSGCEVQILDDFNWEAVTKSALKPWQFTGALYGSVAPAKKALAPLGEWNTYEIDYRGSRITTKLNGVELYAVDTHAVEVPGNEKPFKDRARKGFLGIQRHAPDGIEGEAYAWFRNAFVRR